MAPVQAWAQFLAPGSQEAAQFEQLLRERIEQDYHAEEDLVRETLDSLRESSDKEQLHASLEEMFDDNDVMANWCCETLDRLANKAAAAPPKGPSSPTPAADKPVASDEQHTQQASKRAPIRFALETATVETAPKKASDDKAQKLGGGHKAAAAAAAPDTKQKPAQPPPAAAAAAAAAALAQAAPERRPVGAAANSNRQRSTAAAAPAAPARLLRSIGLIRPAEDGADGNGRSHPRARTRQQAQGEQQQGKPDAGSPHKQQQQHAPPAPQQQQQPQQRKRAADDTQGSGGRRVAAAAGGSSGPGSVFRSALGSLKPQERATTNTKAPAAAAGQPAPQQQQQRGGGGGGGGSGGSGGGSSVFSRIDQNDLARLSAQSALPQTVQQQAKQPPSAKQPQQQQQGTIDALPQSLRSRLGIAAGRTTGDAAAAGAGGAAGGAAGLAGAKQVLQSGRMAGTGAAAAAAAAAPAVGTKRKAGSDAAPAAAAPAQQDAAASAAAAAAAKKTRPSAAPVGSSKPGSGSGGGGSSMPSNVASIKALIAAREAEVARLKFEQASQERLRSRLEADQCSVVVFGPTQDLPELVVKAHFSSCGGDIKRVTLWPRGRDAPAPPFAYVEFGAKADGSGGSAQHAASNAVALSGSTMLFSKITVLRKSDWQASLSKAQRGYPAARPSSGLLPATAGHRTWKGPSATAAAAAQAPASAAGTGQM